MMQIGNGCLYKGDCRETMRHLISQGVKFDSIVTDPPYELGFMGKSWDSSGVAFDPETWSLCHALLKPGGHMLAFGGSRTQHRIAVAIEDAGFEIRDTMMWIYGSGFPKSLDVSKAIDKAAGAEREVVGSKFGLPGYRSGPTGENEIYGVGLANGDAKCAITAPATDAAKQWSGWGTALKPAYEPIIVARKPLEGTVAHNVLKHGVGGINIDGCRVGTGDPDLRRQSRANKVQKERGSQVPAISSISQHDMGRWPANTLHDGSDTVIAEFSKYGETKSGSNPTKRSSNRSSTQGASNGGQQGGYNIKSNGECQACGDSGTVARYFFDTSTLDAPFVYHPKAGKKDRNGSKHPTVKPLGLMRHIVRLTTPPGGTVLDPFAGSGTTLHAALLDGFHAVGCEMTEEYWEDIERRMRHAQRA